MRFLDTIQNRYNSQVKKKGDSVLARLHPELSFREPLLRGGNTQLSSYPDFVKAYQTYVWVRRAISKKQESIGELKTSVVDAEENVIEGHPLNEVLHSVNENSNSVEFTHSFVLDMDLQGEFSFEIVDDRRGRPVEFWHRTPDQVKVVPDKSRPNFPTVYGYKLGDDDDIIPPENFCMIKYKNPLSPYRGIGLIPAVKNGIVIDIYAQQWALQFMKKGARPDYAIIAPEGLTKTEREELEATLIAKYGGQDNWHKPVILEQGVTDIKTFSYPPVDIQWLEQRKVSREEVGSIFGVPDEIMGYGRDTYENFDTAYRVLWLLTLKPMIGYRDIALGTYFRNVRKLLKPNERILTDITGVDVLQEHYGEKLEQATKLFNIGYAPNDINARLNLGMPDTQWGNIGYLPANLYPATSVGPQIESNIIASLEELNGKVNKLIKQDEPFAPNGSEPTEQTEDELTDEVQEKQEEYYQHWDDNMEDYVNLHEAEIEE